MASIGLFIVIVQAFAAAQCDLTIFHEQRNKRVLRNTVSDGDDPGEPLFLSPLITAGCLDEARRRARVVLTPDLCIESYAGYFTVNKTYNSNHFFWYFPSIVEDSSKAPVLLWLQGGPGSSSLNGLFGQNGPLVMHNGTIKRRELNWAQNHHLIYIDNPVGVGYSFTEDERGYCTNETQVGEQLYSSVTQFFKLFPDLQKNKFFISGESYACKFIAALAYAIHEKNPTAETKINLQGMAIGNGWCDPIHHFVYSSYLYQLGFIDWNEKENIEQLEIETVKCIENQDWLGARNNSKKILSGLEINLYNYMTFVDIFYPPFFNFIETSITQKAIHVGNRTFDEFSGPAFISLLNETMKSVAPWFSVLLEHYNVTFYNGQLDVVAAYPVTVNFLRALPFSASGEYARAPRFEWLVQDPVEGYAKVAGFAKTAGRLTELMVRCAGHRVPVDQPLWAHDLITRVTHGIPFH